VAEAEVRADLLEAVRLALDLVVLGAVPVDLLELDLVDLADRVLQAGPLVVLAEVLALVGLEVAAVVARTPSSIPRMAKFLTRWPLVRSPTT
jgi:hypothetical protein